MSSPLISLAVLALLTASLCLPSTVARGRDHIITITSSNAAKKSQFPYMAAIFPDGHPQLWICGGSLIHTQWVLTAASCIVDTNALTVYLGTNNLALIKEKGRQVFYVDKGIPHPQFQYPKNDIALIQLPTSAVLTTYVQPISLAPASSTSFVNGTATLAGFGVIFDESTFTFLNSTKLRTQSFTIAAASECGDIVDEDDEYIFDEDSMICAVGTGMRNACLGDNGGPLVVQGDNGEAIQVGVMSVTTPACIFDLQAGYTDVTKFMSWLEETSGVQLQ